MESVNVWCLTCGKQEFKTPRKCTLSECIMRMCGGSNNERKSCFSFGNWEFSVYSCANYFNFYTVQENKVQSQTANYLH